MKYIVTGCAGFIGSHLVQRLIHDHHEVVGIDDLSWGLAKNLPEDFEFHRIDITDWTALTNNFSLFKGAEGVFHLAAFARIQPSIINPSRCMRTNVNGTLNILEIMRMTGVDKIVYSASSSAYGLRNTVDSEGKQTQIALHEDMPTDCLTPYAVSKLCGEELCKTWGRLYGIKNVSLRYFNVFGERSPTNLQQYSPVVSLFFKQVLQDKSPITVVGSGKQTRDLTYVGDVVNANVKAMNLFSEHNIMESRVSGQTINIGTGQSITINELATKIKNILVTHKKAIRTQHIPDRQGEAMHTLANTKKAADLLGWKAEVTIDAALAHLKTHYIDHGF